LYTSWYENGEKWTEGIIKGKDESGNIIKDV